MSGTETYSTGGTGTRTTGRNADPEAVIEALERPKKRPPAADSYLDPEDRSMVGEGRLPPMELPGFGSKGDDCGKPIDFFCNDCYRTHEIGRTCNTSTCKRCASAWCRDRAENVVAYLKALRYKRYNETGNDQRFHHLTFSPPSPKTDHEADWRLEASDPYERTLEAIKEILAEMGLQGFVAYHPWSGEDNSQAEVLNDDDRGEWKKRLFEGRDWSDVKEELQVRPHFHIIAVGDFVRGDGLSDTVYEETGWILKRITKRNSKRSIDDEDLEDLARVSSYVISHTGLRKTENGNMSAQLRPFGFRYADVDVFPSTWREARGAVRNVVDKTLGIPSARMKCSAEVEKADDEPDAGGATDDRDLDAGVGNGGSSSTSSTWSTGGGGSTSSSNVKRAQCEGSLLIIWKADDVIEREKERDGPMNPRVEHLQTRLEFWREQEDWYGG